ncbi:MAG: hypothetical protein KDA88_24520, partial [Planctomycetaceae bacterium]|nr:hypothetical protein [Planctomycetaceae bacterium]
IYDAYERLHASEVIQRDVSLGNIMISGRRVRLIDFGGGGRAAPGYRDLNTMSHVPMTEAFASDPVRNRERKPTIPDEVHAVAKVCFTILTGQIAIDIPRKEWPNKLKQRGVCAEIAGGLLAKMETPPEKIAERSQAKEF